MRNPSQKYKNLIKKKKKGYDWTPPYWEPLCWYATTQIHKIFSHTESSKKQ